VSSGSAKLDAIVWLGFIVCGWVSAYSRLVKLEASSLAPSLSGLGS